MQITYRVALEVASHEAVVRQAYKDSVGVWTWSVGLTSATGHDVSRYIGKPATLERCLEVYAWALKRYARQVREAFDGHELTEAQFAAALSFHWNTGAIKRAQWVKDFKAGRLNAARRNFMNYRSPSEIIPRREKERDLFFDGVWTNDGTMTEYTRLTKRSTPVWRSAVKVDVRDALKAALGIDERDEGPLDHEPNPDAEQVMPTLTPSAAPDGILALILKAIAKWLGGRS